MVFDLIPYLWRQRVWSARTFGPGPEVAAALEDYLYENPVAEIDGDDISEWMVVVVIALEGAWRAGYTPEQIVEALAAKQTEMEARKWPDWRTAAPGKAIEHERGSSTTKEKQ